MPLLLKAILRDFKIIVMKRMNDQVALSHDFLYFPEFLAF